MCEGVMTWKCLVFSLSEQYSGIFILFFSICGGTLYGQLSNSSLAWKKIDVFKTNDDDIDNYLNSVFRIMSNLVKCKI